MSSKLLGSLALLTLVTGIKLEAVEPVDSIDEHMEENSDAEIAYLETEDWEMDPAEEYVEPEKAAAATPSEKRPPLAEVARRKHGYAGVTLDPKKRAARPEQQTAEQSGKKPEPRKKLKAHFAGSKRPLQNAPDYVPAPKTKKSTRIKNQWVSSKTHPKIPKEEEVDNRDRTASSSQKQTAFGEGNALASSRRASQHLSPDRLIAQAGPDNQMPMKKENSQEGKEKQPDEGIEYPHAGFIAPDGHVYITGEWLYWRTREGGLEYAVERSSAAPGVFTDAVPKKLSFDWQSGFRVGVGVHLPYDGWDLYVNYTDFRPEDSGHASGSVFPLLVYQGQLPINDVTEAHGHWNIDFQTLDVEVGRRYYIGKSLILRPNIGIRGAWIDQHARFEYKGGEVPAGLEYTVHDKNDFKGAGLRAGINSNWYFGAGLSFNGDIFASLVAGHFDLSQDQKQRGIEVIDLDSDFNQLSPNIQMFLGLSWDRNFYHNRCHFGLTLGFESQYWWRQNQMERFTDSSQPIYVRPDEDLSFYGINLRARIDF
ncbi:MAG: Lpg1974 family pore-forming outer membrane protein [Parachlamydiales bacterium]